MTDHSSRRRLQPCGDDARWKERAKRNAMARSTTLIADERGRSCRHKLQAGAAAPAWMRIHLEPFTGFTTIALPDAVMAPIRAKRKPEQHAMFYANASRIYQL